MIKKLPEDTVKKIAAGEVILDPASCVKELIENSIDAGAKRIKIEIERGGKEVIKVSDDGEGIKYEDIPKSIQRFSTSKIEKIDDLKIVKSLGFRGEALASIAEVSFLKIESKHRDEPYGGKIVVEGGKVKSFEEIARSTGTTVVVEKLFFNLPARRKFLKSDSYEAKKVTEVVRVYASIFEFIEFVFISEGKRIFHLFPSSLKERISLLFPDVEKELMEVRHEHPLLSLQGLFEPPDIPERSIPYPVIAVNQRPIRYRTISRAVENAYKNTFNKNPWYILRLSIKPELLDVNIHPSKREVKFHDERFLHDFIIQILKQKIVPETKEVAPSPYYSGEETSPFEFPGRDRGREENLIFWQLKNTYILAQIKSGFIIIDQHAAHERILFEQIIKKERKKQKLLFPVTVHLDTYSMELYKNIKKRLEDMGIKTRIFGENTVLVETIPDDARLTVKEIEELFKEMGENKEVLEDDDEMAKMIACKAAIKAGTPLSQEEMEALINKLFACKTPYFCPHGRPTILRFTLEEIEKKFGRI